MLQNNFSTKYFPQSINELLLEPKFTEVLNKCISNNLLQLLLVGEDVFTQIMIVQCIINTLHIPKSEQLFISQIKDQGVTNMRYEIKQFCQTPSPQGKKILVIDDIHMFADSIQKLFINNIDKWGKNTFIIVTSNNLYSVDECLAARLYPLSIPEMDHDVMMHHMNYICEHENIQLTPEIKEFIIQISEKNLQSIHHILQKCQLLQHDVPITLDLVKQSCTLIHVDELKFYFQLTKERKIKEGYFFLLGITEKGHSVLDILNELYLFIKITTILTEEEKYKCCKVISTYIVHFITIHEEELELLLFTSNIVDIFTPSK